MARTKLASAFLILALLAGCTTQVIWVSGDERGGGGHPDHEETQIFFLGGLGQTRQVNAAAVCGGVEKVSRVESQLSGSNILFSWLTLGILYPLTARVYCLPN